MSAYLIDYENVKSEGIRGILNLSEYDTVIIFYSNNADTLTFETMDMIFSSKANVRKYKVTCGGKNALDFQLSTYLGYLIREGKDTNFFIISKDNGFQHVVDFWKRAFNYEGYIYRFPTIADAYTRQRRFATTLKNKDMTKAAANSDGEESAELSLTASGASDEELSFENEFSEEGSGSTEAEESESFVSEDLSEEETSEEIAEEEFEESEEEASDKYEEESSEEPEEEISEDTEEASEDTEEEISEESGEEASEDTEEEASEELKEETVSLANRDPKKAVSGFTAVVHENPSFRAAVPAALDDPISHKKEFSSSLAEKIAAAVKTGITVTVVNAGNSTVHQVQTAAQPESLPENPAAEVQADSEESNQPEDSTASQEEAAPVKRKRPRRRRSSSRQEGREQGVKESEPENRREPADASARAAEHSVKEEPAKKETIKAEPAKKEAVKSESAKKEAVKAEPVKKEAVKAEPVKKEAVKAEPAKNTPNDASKTEAKAESSKKEVKAESAKKEVKTEPAKKEVKTEPAKKESAKELPEQSEKTGTTPKTDEEQKKTSRRPRRKKPAAEAVPAPAAAESPAPAEVSAEEPKKTTRGRRPKTNQKSGAAAFTD